MKLEIGTYVINNTTMWCSGYRKYPGCQHGSICNIKGSTYCCDYLSSHEVIGIKGVIVDNSILSGSSVIYLVRWENGDMCGKAREQLDLDKIEIRDMKLNQLSII